MDLKICGVTSRDELDILIQEGASYAGLWTGIGGHPRNLSDAKFLELAERCRDITPIAVCVKRPVRDIWVLLCNTDVRHVQLHGFNPPRDIAFLKERGVTVIKTVHVDDAGLSPIERLVDCYRQAGCDIFLIDRFGGGGNIGSGGVCLGGRMVQTWTERLAGARVWLAGGLTADRISDLSEGSGIEAVDVDSAARLNGGAITRKAARLLVVASSPSQDFEVLT